MIPVVARNAAFLAFAIELKHAEYVYTTEFARALDEALEAAAAHMLADAWDAGHTAGDGDCSVMWDADRSGDSVKYKDVVTPNPYRTAK